MAVGRMAYQSGFFPQAVHHFRKALDLINEKGLPQELLSRTLVGLAKALGSMGQFEEGERLMNQALSLDLSDQVTDVELIEDYHQLSLLYWRAHRQELANDALKKAWQLLQDHSNPEEVPDELTAKLMKHRAVLAALNGDNQKSEKLIDEALDFISGSPDLGKFSTIYGDSLMVKLTLLLEKEHFEEAQELLPEALKVLDVTRGEQHIKTLELVESILHMVKEKGREKDFAKLQIEADRIKAMLKKKELF
jgi:tetratricopeptide (TPR) repeat protein